VIRKYILSAAMLVSCLPAIAVDGFNMPGLDHANFNADTSFICRDSCGGDTRCPTTETDLNDPLGGLAAFGSVLP
jgi:hypothetical protein